jgi:hypothetical protein
MILTPLQTSEHIPWPASRQIEAILGEWIVDSMKQAGVGSARLSNPEQRKTRPAMPGAFRSMPRRMVTDWNT